MMECEKSFKLKRFFSALGTTFIQFFLIMFSLIMFEELGMPMVFVAWLNPYFYTLDGYLIFFVIMILSFAISNVVFEFARKEKLSPAYGALYGVIEGFLALLTYCVVSAIFSGIIILFYIGVIYYTIYITIAIITNIIMNIAGV